MLLVLDFETYYSSKDYTLKKMSMLEYVRDPRFKVHGLGYMTKQNDDWTAPLWVSGSNVRSFLGGIDWAQTDVVMHNAKFDGLILCEKYGVQPRSWIDTKGMSRAVHGKSIPDHTLATIAKKYGLVDKGVMQTDGICDLSLEQEHALAQYCRHDVALTADIFDQMAKRFPLSQYKILSQTVQMFVRPQLELDLGLLRQTAESERARKTLIFRELGIDKAEFSSNVKFPQLLAREGFEVPKKVSPRTGKEIAAIALGDPDFLDMLEGENERLRTLCEARVAAKSTLLETRSEKLVKIASTGRWSFDVEFSGANQTHRFSGGKGAGGNPQNFTACRDAKAHSAGHDCPGRLRKAVKAPAGYKLVVGDFSNIELRLVAYLSKDPGLISAIEANRDLYCDFASTFYGRTITKSHDIERRFGKCAILGLGYGMGPVKFQRTVRLQTDQKISLEDATRAVELYRGRYTKVRQLWYALDSTIPVLSSGKSGRMIGLPVSIRDGALVLPSGLEIRYPNLRCVDDEWVFDAWGKTKTKPETKKLYGGKLLENMSQALAGELCKEAAAQFGGLFSGQVHDEIHLLVRAPLADIFKRRLERVMTTPPNWLPQMKLQAEVGVGENWLDSK